MWKRGIGELDWSKLAHNGDQYDDGSTVVDNEAVQNTGSILTIVRPHKNYRGFTLHILLKLFHIRFQCLYPSKHLLREFSITILFIQLKNT